MDVALDGGLTRCRYCNATSEVTARARLAAFKPPPPPRLSDTDRMARLWSQVEHPYLPPPGVAPLVQDGPGGVFVPPHRLAEAMQTWQNARRRCQLLQALDAAEDLFCLTTLLANQLLDAADQARHRAMLESALEAFFLPRHRTMMAADLASHACRAGDLAAGERWFALVDPSSDDLLADSHYRGARSRIAMTRGDWQGVLVVLGNRSGKVPIHKTFEGLLTVSRAHAWEQLGQVDAATHELASQMQKSPGLRATIESVAHARGMCARSCPAAAALLGRR